MCLIAYVSLIIYARVGLTLYYIACLPFFTVAESKFPKQARLEKAQQGSTTTVQNKICFEIL